MNQAEHLAARDLKAAAYRWYQQTARKADYLDHLKRMHRSPQYAASAHRDAFVGFAAGKGDAKMHMAMGILATA
jgi:hypothetical protein